MNFGTPIKLPDGRVGAFIERRGDMFKILFERSEGVCGFTLIESQEAIVSDIKNSELNDALSDLEFLKKFSWGPVT